MRGQLISARPPMGARGGIGRRARFRSVFRKEWWFDSTRAHQVWRVHDTDARGVPHPRSEMTHKLYHGDLPEGVGFGAAVAVDTEAMGLNPHRDRLCLVQLSAGDGDAHLVQLAPDDYAAPRLRCLLADPGVT